jgi:hypothetical protein
MSKFKTLRHIETVRNYINAAVVYLLKKSEVHDLSKLHTPEVETFDKYTEKLKGSTYGSAEYKQYLVEMTPALDHHYKHNRHHPEHFVNGIKDMDLFDMVEMLCDWKASSMRHDDGDIHASITYNQKRFNYSDDIMSILHNTADKLDEFRVRHNAEES